jgi:hypothetical protein
MLTKKIERQGGCALPSNMWNEVIWRIRKPVEKYKCFLADKMCRATVKSRVELFPILFEAGVEGRDIKDVLLAAHKYTAHPYLCNQHCIRFDFLRSKIWNISSRARTYCGPVRVYWWSRFQQVDCCFRRVQNNISILEEPEIHDRALEILNFTWICQCNPNGHTPYIFDHLAKIRQGSDFGTWYISGWCFRRRAWW